MRATMVAAMLCAVGCGGKDEAACELANIREAEITRNYQNDQAGVDAGGNPLDPPYPSLPGQTVPVRFVTQGSCIVEHSDPSREQQFNMACAQYNEAVEKCGE